MQTEAQADAGPLVTSVPPKTSTRFWPEGWWKLMEFRIGIIPLPVFIVMGALIAGFVVTGKISSEISMAIVVFSFFGFTCAEIGKRIPLVKDIGGAGIKACHLTSWQVTSFRSACGIVSISAFSSASSVSS